MPGPRRTGRFWPDQFLLNCCRIAIEGGSEDGKKKRRKKDVRRMERRNQEAQAKVQRVTINIYLTGRQLTLPTLW